MLVGVVLGLIYAFLTVTLKANQIVCGLAMLTFGMGLSGFLGKSVSGVSANLKFEKFDLPLLSQIPILGKVSSHQTCWLPHVPDHPPGHILPL
jgi:simple sugar transport system permease protein